MREHSLLLNQLCLFCLWLKGQWQESAVYTVGVRCAEALNRGLEESRILCFFRADWDHGSGADQLSSLDNCHFIAQLFCHFQHMGGKKYGTASIADLVHHLF